MTDPVTIDGFASENPHELRVAPPATPAQARKGAQDARERWLECLAQIHARARQDGNQHLQGLAEEAAELDFEIDATDDARGWFDNQFPPDDEAATWMVCFPNGPLEEASHGLVHKRCLPFPAGSLKALQAGWRALTSTPDGAVCAACGEHEAPTDLQAWLAQRPGLRDDPRVAMLLDDRPSLALASGATGETLPSAHAIESVILRLYTTWLIAETHGDGMFLAGVDDARFERHLAVPGWGTALQSVGWGVFVDGGFQVTGPEVEA